MFALLRRYAGAIWQEGFHQHDDLAAVVGPLPGFGQGQRDMVIGAAFAAAYAGEMGVHGLTDNRAVTGVVTQTRQAVTTWTLNEASCAPVAQWLRAGITESHSVTAAVLLFLLYRQSSVPGWFFMWAWGYWPRSSTAV